MRPTQEIIDRLSDRRRKAPEGYEKIGSGAYAKAYLQPDGTVLKVSASKDSCMDFIEWCYRRVKRFGKGSKEMHGLPQVMHFGQTKKGWWAVMPRYETAHDYNDRGVTEWVNGRVAVQAVAKLIREVFDVDYLDLHNGNVMYDAARNQWIATDPMADSANGSGSTAPLVSLYTKKAAQRGFAPVAMAA